jgi:hypothetical protein
MTSKIAPEEGGTRQPIAGPLAWHGPDLANSGDWIWPLDAEALAELDTGLRGIAARGLSWPDFGREDFPLPHLGPILDRVADRLEHGKGIALIRGLPTARYTVEEMRQIFWGLASHLGAIRHQNPEGELFGEVRDEMRAFGQVLGETFQPGGDVPLTSRARTRTNGPLRFHTDRTDLLALLCARPARAGGAKLIASSITIHNEILARRPDLLELLFEDYHHVPQDQDGDDNQRHYALPVFASRDGHFAGQYTRTAVEAAQGIPGVPRMTAAQDEALDLHARIAHETSHRLRLEAGDFLILNSHVTYHAREVYEDADGPDRDRLLLRLWISPPNSRPLPESFARLWGSTEAGVPRGGILQRA